MTPAEGANEADKRPQKVQLSKRIKGFDPRNPHLAMEWLGFLLEGEEEVAPLKELLKDTPWTLKEFRHYAQKDPYFDELLQEVENRLLAQLSQSRTYGVTCNHIGENMDDKNMAERQTDKKRDLTPQEQKRIQSLREKRREKTCGNTPDFLEIYNKEDEYNAGLKPKLKERLSTKDGVKESEARIFEATGCLESQNGYSLLLSMAEALFTQKPPIEEQVSKLNKLGLLLREFAPKDAIEGSLCAQAIVCQEKAMQFIRRASYQDRREWAATHHNAASKLLARSQNALQMLISYRRGGQKVTVEHVHMAPGSQAAFGHFEAHHGGGGANQESIRGTP